jgi:hypothetical protein
MSQKPDLAAALANAGGSTRRRVAALRTEPAQRRARRSNPSEEAGRGKSVYQSPSRGGTAPITVHFPKNVRDQLKILAIEQGSTLHNIAAEAYNDLFAKYGKPEIAPHQPGEK